MNLHIMHDEKIISRTIKYFEDALPGENVFIILLKKERPRKYVFVDSPSVHYVIYNSDNFWCALSDIRDYKNIICHYLSDEIIDFILKTQINCPITWIVWGNDLYNKLLIKRGYELFAYPKDIENRKTLKNRLADTILYFKRANLYKKRIVAISKISNVCIESSDFELLKEYYPEFYNLKKIPFFYYPIDDVISADLRDKAVSGNNIIVGNSAQYTNNHKYVFERLSKLTLGNRKVIVPLSYGNDPKYVIEAGKILGDSFCPITKFLPLDDYNKLLSSASTFIYGNYRQEAVGNILVALYLGATVFFDSRNPLLNEFLSSGYVVFSMNDLPSKIDYRLSEEEKIRNRDLMKKNFSMNKLRGYIRKAFG